MAELGDFLVSGDSKVHVDIEMLDYGYIEKCSDAHKLRAIVDILKSGKEGFYPDVSFINDVLIATYISSSCWKRQRLSCSPCFLLKKGRVFSG